MTAPTDTVAPGTPEPDALAPAEVPATDSDTGETNRVPKLSLKMAATAAVILFAAVFAFGGLSGATTPTGSADADTAALAVISSEIVTSAKDDGGAVDAIGGYLPGTGMVLTVQLADTGSQPVAQWVSDNLDPFAETLAIMPPDESIVVTINEIEKGSARVWSLPVSALGTSVRDWNKLVAPATFESNEVAVAAEPVPDPSEVMDIEPTIDEEPVAEPTAEPEPTAAPEPTPEPEPEPTVEPTAVPEPTPVADDANDVDVDTGVGDGIDNDGLGGRNDGIDNGGFGGDGDRRVVSAFEDPDTFEPNFGSWVLRDGVYSQQDATGFGYSASYAGIVPDVYDVSVDMRAPTGDLNAGIIYGMPEKGRKHGGKVVDLTAESTYLRWGEYDDVTGDWEFIGGAPVEPALVQDEWQNLKLEVRQEGTSVLLNNQFIATLDPVETGGHVALVVSVANVEFKDFFVTRPGGELVTDGDDNTGDRGEFDGGTGDRDFVVFDDELREWTLLSGSWTAESGLLSQNNGQAYDQMVHFSNFEQDDYRVQVDLRAKDDSIFSGGILFNVETFGARPNSQLFDIVDDGRVVRWAGYDENGVFSYVGGLRTSSAFDPDEWHTIAVEVRAGTATFVIDGEVIGRSENVGDAGYVGLLTSLAAMDFRNFSVTTLGS